MYPFCLEKYCYLSFLPPMRDCEVRLKVTEGIMSTDFARLVRVQCYVGSEEKKEKCGVIVVYLLVFGITFFLISNQGRGHYF